MSTVLTGPAAASVTYGTTAGTAAQGNDSRITTPYNTFDDPTNASSLSTPAIINGTVLAIKAAGVTIGAGQTQAVRTATLTGLQAALNYAGANNKFFEIEPGVYEIYGSVGLVVPPAANLTWRGSLQSQIVQFSTNAPVLTVGDPANNGYSGFQKISGFNLSYGVTQAGQTNAIGLLWGSSFGNTIDNFNVGSYAFPPSVGIKITSTSTSNAFFFQNALRDGHIQGSQVSLFALLMNGTGNLFENIYMQNGADKASRQALSGPAIDMRIVGAGQSSDNIFSRINLEHFSAGGSYYAFGIQMNTAITTTFVGLHVEDVAMQTNSTFLYQIGGQAKFIDTMIYNLYASGSASSVFQMAGYGETLSLDGLTMRWDSQASGAVAANLQLISLPGSNDTNPLLKATNIVTQDDPGNNATKLILDGILTQPMLGGTQIAEYQADNLLAKTKRFQTTISTNYTHYGAHDDAVLFVPASLSAAATITLHSKMKASGTGSTMPTPTGCIVRIRRQSGTYANTLTVVDQPGGTTLTTNSAAGADYLYRFNGTNWAAVT